MAKTDTTSTLPLFICTISSASLILNRYHTVWNNRLLNMKTVPCQYYLCLIQAHSIMRVSPVRTCSYTYPVWHAQGRLHMHPNHNCQPNCSTNPNASPKPIHNANPKRNVALTLIVIPTQERLELHTKELVESHDQEIVISKEMMRCWIRDLKICLV